MWPETTWQEGSPERQILDSAPPLVMRYSAGNQFKVFHQHIDQARAQSRNDRTSHMHVHVQSGKFVGFFQSAPDVLIHLVLVLNNRSGPADLSQRKRSLYDLDFVTAIQAMPRSSSSICVANVGVTRGPWLTIGENEAKLARAGSEVIEKKWRGRRGSNPRPPT